MLKLDRLPQIEKLWKSRSRNQKWEDIQWETYVRTEHGVSPSMTDDKLGYYLRKTGFIFWSMGIHEIEGMDYFEWDMALLDWLHVWYSLPEHWEIPIFINEDAYAICIPYLSSDRFELLFYHPSSVALGMENWEKCQREWHAELHERTKRLRNGEQPSYPTLTPNPKAQALASLDKERSQ
jgi:hypothetical protein